MTGIEIATVVYICIGVIHAVIASWFGVDNVTWAGFFALIAFWPIFLIAAILGAK